MPAFYYECPEHGIQMFTGESFTAEVKAERKCRICGGPVTRAPRTASSRSVEVIDHGWEARPVERLDNAREIHHEHAAKGRERRGINDG